MSTPSGGGAQRREVVGRGDQQVEEEHDGQPAEDPAPRAGPRRTAPAPDGAAARARAGWPRRWSSSSARLPPTSRWIADRPSRPRRSPALSIRSADPVQGVLERHAEPALDQGAVELGRHRRRCPRARRCRAPAAASSPACRLPASSCRVSGSWARKAALARDSPDRAGRSRARPARAADRARVAASAPPLSSSSSDAAGRRRSRGGERPLGGPRMGSPAASSRRVDDLVRGPAARRPGRPAPRPTGPTGFEPRRRLLDPRSAGAGAGR